MASREISANELYELFVATVRSASSEKLGTKDEELAWWLFEEFDAGATSFLHENSVTRLLEAGLTDAESAREACAIRASWMNLQEQAWTMDEVRSREEWRELFDACDSLLRRLTKTA